MEHTWKVIKIAGFNTNGSCKGKCNLYFMIDIVVFCTEENDDNIHTCIDTFYLDTVNTSVTKLCGSNEEDVEFKD